MTSKSDGSQFESGLTFLRKEKQKHVTEVRPPSGIENSARISKLNDTGNVSTFMSSNVRLRNTEMSKLSKKSGLNPEMEPIE